MSARVDLLVVGGGITGLSTAVHGARRGLRTVLVEAAGLGGVSTQRSGALVRTHYADEGSARLALRGLEQFERFEEHYGGPAGFVATGFAYVPAADELADGAFAARLALLQGVGIETERLDADALRKIDPSLDIGDVGAVAYEPRSGYADPAVTTATLSRAARSAGAQLRDATAVATLLTDGAGTVVGARLAGGERVEASTTVLCAGAWSPALARTAGVDVPVRPTAVKLAFFERAAARHLTVIDAPNGIYLRPDGERTTLVGRRTWTDEPMADADAPLPAVDRAFVDDARRRLALRQPGAMGSRPTGTRAGMLDMTPDGLPLVGPSTHDGLWLCCGWSGTGFKTGPSVGEALAAWIDGEPPPVAVRAMQPDRPMHGAGAAVRSPH